MAGKSHPQRPFFQDGLVWNRREGAAKEVSGSLLEPTKWWRRKRVVTVGRFDGGEVVFDGGSECWVLGKDDERSSRERLNS